MENLITTFFSFHQSKKWYLSWPLMRPTLHQDCCVRTTKSSKVKSFYTTVALVCMKEMEALHNRFSPGTAENANQSRVMRTPLYWFPCQNLLDLVVGREVFGNAGHVSRDRRLPRRFHIHDGVADHFLRRRRGSSRLRSRQHVPRRPHRPKFCDALPALRNVLCFEKETHVGIVRDRLRGDAYSKQSGVCRQGRGSKVR